MPDETDNDPVRAAIEAGDAVQLAARVAEAPDRATSDLAWYDPKPDKTYRVPPLHYVCHVVFDKQVTPERALAMAKVLLNAGEDPGRVFAETSGDTFLISAASLGVEDVGLELVARGATVDLRGTFGATALHWCAFMGLPRLAAACLDAGANIELRDKQNESTPLQWAVYAWSNGTNGNRAAIPATVRVLVERGAEADEKAHALFDLEG